MAVIRNAPSASSALPSSGRLMIDALTQDHAWGESTIQYFLGGPGVLNWDGEFRDLYEDLYRGPMDAPYAYVQQTERAFEMVEAVINIDFQRITDARVARDAADLVLATSGGNRGLEGFHQFVGDATRAGSGPTADHWSLGVFSSDMRSMNATPERGGGEYLSWTILHEIGHGLGLVHSHEERWGLPAQPELGEALDNEAYTVMSYDPASPSYVSGHAVTMMPLDIAALQTLYGARNYAPGGSLYTIAPRGTTALNLTEGNVTIGDALYAIWDTGGNDTIRTTGLDDVLINLNDASLDRNAAAPQAVQAIQNSSFYDSLRRDDAVRLADSDYTAGGFRSGTIVNGTNSAYSYGGSFTIAHGVVIENAVGGGGDDVLIGNEFANVLVGGAGDDLLAGGARQRHARGRRGARHRGLSRVELGLRGASRRRFLHRARHRRAGDGGVRSSDGYRTPPVQ